MTVPLRRPAHADGLFLWVLHRFSEVFAERAVLKGGIALRLLDCPRSTTDIDYVFAPYRSKKEVERRIREVLGELEDAEVEIAMHSKMLRATVRVDEASIQIEVNVDRDVPGIPLPTGGFAVDQGQPSRIVRVMALDCALAHKLAAWNERRLLRDLYDCYYLHTRLGVMPDPIVLDRRLACVESRLPKMRGRKSTTRRALAAELRTELKTLDEARVRAELAPILPPTEIVGLPLRLRASGTELAEWLEGKD